ncbi:type II toxin-antitoxin system HipA family toxin [Pseudomonas sp. H3(2019)]|uniref:type II toxin-antitoxin system HipA family toxin n=1 Tax=Pseudomonas sp. H3(2019) TaxID=2598724 RepID=UPI00211459AA|nr:type II toxin-antitoxin system HipA family toxin [Pseudomonas sp. H3(2019)]
MNIPAAYIYMEHPLTAETVTLGRLSMGPSGSGEFVYSPAYLAQNDWVPDPIRYPPSDQVFRVTTNNGIPGFIRDCMPDSWGEQLLKSLHGQAMTPIEMLLRSPNNDRSGNLMAGTARTSPPGIGGESVPSLQGLGDFIDTADIIQSHQLIDPDRQKLLLVRQRSSLGGARPKRTLRDGNILVLAKARDRFDTVDIPAIEHACMTFAASKGIHTARTRLITDKRSTLLVDRFDRVEVDGRMRRVPMLSALTLLDADWSSTDHSRWRYAGVADEMRRRGVPLEDLEQFYVQMCFHVLVGNDDAHTKNLAIIWRDGSWRLSPMYDIVPSPQESPATMAMALGNEGTLISRQNILSHHEHFGLDLQGAETILDRVLSWESELREHYMAQLSGVDYEAAIGAISSARVV